MIHRMWVKRMTEKKVVLRNKRYADEETEKAFSFVIKTKSKANSRIKTKLYASILTHTFLDWYATIYEERKMMTATALKFSHRNFSSDGLSFLFGFLCQQGKNNFDMTHDRLVFQVDSPQKKPVSKTISRKC